MEIGDVLTEEELTKKDLTRGGRFGNGNIFFDEKRGFGYLIDRISDNSFMVSFAYALKNDQKMERIDSDRS